MSVSAKYRSTSFLGVWGHVPPENFRVIVHLWLILRNMALWRNGDSLPCTSLLILMCLNLCFSSPYWCFLCSMCLCKHVLGKVLTMDIPCILYCPDQLTSYTVITGRLVVSNESVAIFSSTQCAYSLWFYLDHYPMGLFEWTMNEFASLSVCHSVCLAKKIWN